MIHERAPIQASTRFAYRSTFENGFDVEEEADDFDPTTSFFSTDFGALPDFLLLAPILAVAAMATSLLGTALLDDGVLAVVLATAFLIVLRALAAVAAVAATFCLLSLSNKFGRPG